MFSATLSSRWPRFIGNPRLRKRAEVRLNASTGPEVHEVALSLEPYEAAELGRRLLDWANSADPLAAYHAVGDARHDWIDPHGETRWPR